MTVSLAVAIAIFFLISIRQWLPPAVRIWQIMLVGAVVLLLTGRIAPSDALEAIDWNVIGYLFGVFSIASALYDSGFPHTVSEKIAGSGASLARALFLFMLIVSIVSVVLTNDAGAVIGTPIALALAIAYRIRPAVPLVALCVIVTVASMMSPVGNPQNILIVADGHFANPIGTFALWLTVPTILSLAFAYFWLLRCLKRENETEEGNGDLPAPTRRLAWPAYLSAGLLAVLVIGDSLLQGRIPALDIPLGYLSLIACLPVYMFSPHRISLLRALDWPTLIFFLAMFVVTGAVLQSGALQTLLGSWRARLDDPVVITAIGFWASQLFSNVPVVEIYLNLLSASEQRTLMLLSAMSTLAGNLFIISAASNVIVVQQAERYGATPFSFWQFTGLVIPVTVVSIAVSYAWVVWIMPAPGTG
ncbi:SLC13 family permease [Hoeflea poritis]|uniref:SLC13 family permease n=1 Tax=Hoeflea poritis TaxID=2993659 RepID=A0ABT4VTC4_9HYPH|nr:SLC13 family permease [Hoeflea poritis]MDA4847425.1 SLC13 family permease [Hoeflea poritis]